MAPFSKISSNPPSNGTFFVPTPPPGLYNPPAADVQVWYKYLMETVAGLGGAATVTLCFWKIIEKARKRSQRRAARRRRQEIDQGPHELDQLENAGVPAADRAAVHIREHHREPNDERAVEAEVQDEPAGVLENVGNHVENNIEDQDQDAGISDAETLV